MFEKSQLLVFWVFIISIVGLFSFWRLRIHIKTTIRKSKQTNYRIRKLRILATEIFKTINNLNPPYMKAIFTLNTIRNPNNKKLLVKTISTKKYGTDSLRHLGPRIWNCLPTNIRNSENIFVFKNLIITWSGPQCSCTACTWDFNMI